MTLDLDRLPDEAVSRDLPSREEALAVLASADDDLLGVVAAAQARRFTPTHDRARVS